ncbi:MAG TPA: hypothetical protein VHL34_24565 [Rhizomicrobium sp.]|jgi:hypothetical protein|nr:hypothetical protein [Rhizomicrobium sp.]
MADYWDQYEFILTPEQALSPMNGQLSDNSLGLLPAQERAIRAWGAAGGGTATPTTATGTTSPTSTTQGGDPLAFIAQWQASHPATRDSYLQLANALKTQFGIDRFDYNGTPSNNEFLINGEKVKVMGGEDSSSPSWFAYGSDDGWRPDGGAGATGGLPAGYSLDGSGPLASFSAPGLAAPWTQQFHARSPEEIKNDPAYQFQLQQGIEGIQRNRAARGTVATGGALKDLDIFSQGLASTYNDKYYNRDINEYQMNRDSFWNNQNNAYNKLSGFAQMGQNAATATGNFGSGYANNAQTGANNVGNLYTGQANANASGTIAGANATNLAGGGLANALGEIDWSRLFKRRTSGGTTGIQNPVGYDESL